MVSVTIVLISNLFLKLVKHESWFMFYYVKPGIYNHVSNGVYISLINGIYKSIYDIFQLCGLEKTYIST